MNILIILLGVIIIYLYASIPFTYLIGKYIFNVDITKVGSKNVGGTNLGRVAGKKGFIFAFIMDASKGVFAVVLAHFLGITPIILGAAALIGHAFPLFFHFNGGKGVATACGFVLAYTPLAAVLALVVFILVLYWKKYVSLASLVAIGSYLVYILIYNIIYIYNSGTISKNLSIYFIVVFVLYIFIIYLHKNNIKRINAGTESKINWM